MIDAGVQSVMVGHIAMSTYINTYSGSRKALRQTVAKLMGKSEFKRASPVDAGCSKPPDGIVRKTERPRRRSGFLRRGRCIMQR